ncbi:Bifunctional purine biosynthetic protein ADE1 [Zancudomyces culisetae]|uniref:Phosphoribosylformylglycinamidine cyclo-ligase n=1 Tax=Zancudomyces culisetae TaxID=1213189 RepID=A0A1R1PDW4_ZANCU|nr:Bifunctional purine biosynthetic protein ADE1 [Zancudomyces culisetae]|eukprot:OMH79185.1 Bifunctional purine biosynthetic protein ADE1 [Zancudomyces culisetae]
MNILIVGNGGREHALSWKLSKSPKVNKVFVAPGNGGTFMEGGKIVNVTVPEVVPMEGDDETSRFSELVKFAIESKVDLVIPGPELPLVQGISDAFKKVGISCFGPSQKAAMIEGSKAYSKEFMKRNGIPTAEYEVFSDYEKAKNYIESRTFEKIVVKASGLAGGKGVVIANSKQEALQAAKEILVDRVFASGGSNTTAGEEDENGKVVIEEFLEGEELSILAISDGYSVVTFPAAQDHKQIYEGDLGPNTGGMGTYSPATISGGAAGNGAGMGQQERELMQAIETKVVRATIDGMRKEGTPFVGCLFTGLMITKTRATNDGEYIYKPMVLEYNCRFGDPETQAVMMLIPDNFAELCFAAANGCLDSVKYECETDQVGAGGSGKYSACVILASEGYPQKYQVNKEITFKFDQQNNSDDVKVFHSGTKMVQQTSVAGEDGSEGKKSNDYKLVTSGGRVLAVTGVSTTSLQDALDKVYSRIEQIEFEGKYCRRDIGHRQLSKLKAAEQKAEADNSNAGSSGGKLTYADAGVNVELGNKLVEIIKPMVKQTRREGADSELGGFGGVVELAKMVTTGSGDGGSGLDLKDNPLLVTATDGVGTKLLLGQRPVVKRQSGSAQPELVHDSDRVRGLGIDLVAMQVNDIIVQGAEPLVFLDYYASSKLNVSVFRDFIAGVCDGCKQANCALVGGETAEMPGMYDHPTTAGDNNGSEYNIKFDVAGFAVGIVPKAANLLPKLDNIRCGDVLVGLGSSGVHSNGFSLVRRVLSEMQDKQGIDIDSYVAPWSVGQGTDGNGVLLLDELLAPTKIYVKSCIPLVNSGKLKALCHITGGGFIDNIPRILPKDLGVVIDAKSWELPNLFKWLKTNAGGIDAMEMCRTFNCGIGMVAIVAASDVNDVVESFRASGETVHVIGQVVEYNQNSSDSRKVEMTNLDSWE